MELIFNLLKQLASTLSTTEFLLVLALVLLSSWTVLKFVLKHSQKKGGLLSLLTSEDPNEKIEELSKKFEAMQLQNVANTEKVLLAFEKFSDEAKIRNMHYNESIEDVLTLRKEFAISTATLVKEIEDINYQFKMHYQHDQQSHETSKDLIRRISESIERIFIQLEKSDEFFRTTVPEFRTYHKDLSKELSNLGRDVTLIERGIQTQINTQNAVKLR
jgi:hypothetical protein